MNGKVNFVTVKTEIDDLMMKRETIDKTIASKIYQLLKTKGTPVSEASFKQDIENLLKDMTPEEKKNILIQVCYYFVSNHTNGGYKSERDRIRKPVNRDNIFG